MRAAKGLQRVTPRRQAAVNHAESGCAPLPQPLGSNERRQSSRQMPPHSGGTLRSCVRRRNPAEGRHVSNRSPRQDQRGDQAPAAAFRTVCDGRAEALAGVNSNASRAEAICERAWARQKQRRVEAAGAAFQHLVVTRTAAALAASAMTSSAAFFASSARAERQVSAGWTTGGEL